MNNMRRGIFKNVCFLKDGWGGDPEPWDDEEDDYEPGAFGWLNGKRNPKDDNE